MSLVNEFSVKNCVKLGVWQVVEWYFGFDKGQTTNDKPNSAFYKLLYALHLETTLVETELNTSVSIRITENSRLLKSEANKQTKVGLVGKLSYLSFCEKELSRNINEELKLLTGKVTARKDRTVIKEKKLQNFMLYATL